MQLIDMRPFIGERDQFYAAIANSNDNKLYNVDWIHALLKRDSYTTEVLIFAFLPSFVYLAVSALYLVYFNDVDIDGVIA